MILRDASPQERDEVLEQTHALWSDGLDLAAYREYVRTMMESSWAKAGNLRFLVLVRRADQRVLAAVKLYRLRACLNEMPVMVGGVGAVFTLPSERGHGHAAEMISRAHKIMAERGDLISLLYSEIGAVYYARMGYQEMDPHPVSLRVPEQPPAGPSAPPVRRMHRTDLEQVMQIRKTDDGPAMFRLCRDSDYWKYLLARASFPTASLGRNRWESRLMLAGRDGYLWSLFTEGPEGPAARLLEFGEVRPGAALPALLDELFEQCRSRGIRSIDAWLSSGKAARDRRLADLITPVPSAGVVPMWFPLEEQAAALMRRDAPTGALHMADRF
ncbi:MAG: GNAT family N-acetyltransferase [Acidobacteriota bacterium]